MTVRSCIHIVSAILSLYGRCKAFVGLWSFVSISVKVFEPWSQRLFSLDDPEDPLRNMYDVDNAGTVITFADWYHS